MNKYRAKKLEIDGIKFDSKREADRYIELKALERAGKIEDLKVHLPFELIPAQYLDGKCVERAVKYIADFSYYDKENVEIVVEDVKGCRHSVAYDLFVIKRKLMLKEYGVRVREIL